ncbi:hypothetical protein ACWD11_33540 [Streptomyces sp. NPDC002776]
MQGALDLWLTSSSDPPGFEQAGALGLHVLTGLLFQQVEGLVPRVRAYLVARR